MRSQHGRAKKEGSGGRGYQRTVEEVAVRSEHQIVEVAIADSEKVGHDAVSSYSKSSQL